jgi:hypothetical protein
VLLQKGGVTILQAGTAVVEKVKLLAAVLPTVLLHSYKVATCGCCVA